MAIIHSAFIYFMLAFDTWPSVPFGRINHTTSRHATRFPLEKTQETNTTENAKTPGSEESADGLEKFWNIGNAHTQEHRTHPPTPHRPP